MGTRVAFGEGMTPPLGTTPTTPRTPPPAPPPAKTEGPKTGPAQAPPATTQTRDRDVDKLETQKLPWSARYDDARAGRSALAPNTQGPAVKKLQDELSMAGYDVPTSGVYDARTQVAVAQFQAAHGIKPGPQSPRGWGDQHTLAALEKDMATRRAVASQHPAGSEDRATVLGLIRSSAFNQLDDKQRQNLLQTVGGTDHPSKEARDNVKRLLLDNGYASASPADQKKMLDDFMARGGHLPGNVEPPAGKFEGPPAAHELRGREELGQGWRTEKLHIDGRDIEVNSHNAGTGDVPSTEDVAQAIGQLPKADRDRIAKVMVVDANHNTGKDVAAVFNAETNTVTVFQHAANKDVKRLAGTLSHEVGHGAAHAAFGDVGDPRWKRWERAAAADGLPPSRYARANADEDFGETYALYQMTKGTPEFDAARAKHPARFAILDELTKGQ